MAVTKNTHTRTHAYVIDSTPGPARARTDCSVCRVWLGLLTVCVSSAVRPFVFLRTTAL